MSAGERDFASLALRAAIGPMLIAHGTNKVFGQGGLEGTTRWFDSLGLRPAAVHARMAAATEIGAGTLITLGAANPLPSAAVVGLMATAAATDHKGKGFFVFKGGWEYTAVVARRRHRAGRSGLWTLVRRPASAPQVPLRRGSRPGGRRLRTRLRRGPPRRHLSSRSGPTAPRARPDGESEDARNGESDLLRAVRAS